MRQLSRGPTRCNNVALATCNNLACLADDRHDELPDYRQDEQLKPQPDTAAEGKRGAWRGVAAAQIRQSAERWDRGRRRGRGHGGHIETN